MFSASIFSPSCLFSLAKTKYKVSISKVSIPTSIQQTGIDSSDEETLIAGLSTAGDLEAEEAAKEEFVDLEALSKGEVDKNIRLDSNTHT